MRSILLALSLAAFLSCKTNDAKQIDEDDYSKTKQTLEQKEKKSPLRFLKAEGDYHKNIIGQTVVKGTVENTGTVASFKNVRVKMLFYNKEGKLFENHEELMDETIAPGESKKFKGKYRTQEKTDSVAVSVMSADVEE